MLSTHLRLGPPRCFSLSASLTNKLHAILFSPFALHARPPHCPCLIIVIVFANSKNHAAPSYAVFSILPSLNPLRSKYHKNTVLVRDQLLHPKRIVRDQVSHPYRTTGKIIVLYILLSKFFEKYTRGEKRSELNGSKRYQNSISS
jgi:hypothetical protein